MAGSDSRGVPPRVDSASGAASPYQPNAGRSLISRTMRLSGLIHRWVSTCRNGRPSGARAIDSSAANRARAAATACGDCRNAAPQL